MIRVVKELEKWLEELKNYETINYENLPELELYMDQVVTFLDNQLTIYSNGIDKAITSSMINNYVKDTIIKSPTSKRYNKEHLAELIELGALKRVLSIAEIKELFTLRHYDHSLEKILKIKDTNPADGDAESIYSKYKSLHDEYIHEAAKDSLALIQEFGTEDLHKKLPELSISLALKANSYLLVSQNIISLLKQLKQFEIKRQAEEEKKKAENKEKSSKKNKKQN